MKHLTEQQKTNLKQLLLQEKHKVEEQLAQFDHFGMSASFRDSTGDLSTNDNHPADLGTEMFERGKDIALNENREIQLANINTAMQKWSEGKYGICTVCGQSIPYERLEALPTAATCVQHSPNPNENNRRPLEEAVLIPPFGRSSLDEQDDQTEFDGEDAWQIVESWGTSNTPAMAEDPNISDYDEMYIESDENVGYVEPIESFLATDIYGKQPVIVRNKAYESYIDEYDDNGLL